MGQNSIYQWFKPGGYFASSWGIWQYLVRIWVVTLEISFGVWWVEEVRDAITHPAVQKASTQIKELSKYGGWQPLVYTAVLQSTCHIVSAEWMFVIMPLLTLYLCAFTPHHLSLKDKIWSEICVTHLHPFFFISSVLFTPRFPFQTSMDFTTNQIITAFFFF